MEVIQVEGSTQVILAVQLVIELAEPDILIGKPGVGAEDRLGIRIRRRALGRRNRRHAGLRKCRAADVADGVDLPRAVIGKEVEEPVLDDRTAHASAELLLLVHGLGIVAQGLLDRIESVERRIA